MEDYKIAYTYKDLNGEAQYLNLKIYHEYVANTIEFDFDDTEALEIYALLISKNYKEINEFIEECLQEDDIPTMAQLAQRGEI
tara:strand:+ start:778 stop:1026 length:249 start_codon:yes stop_codon:yes gene_type:complete